jgi:hypothetical protein
VSLDFARPEVVRVLECTCGVVLLQVGAINGVPEALALYAYGADCDFAICYLGLDLGTPAAVTT